ncbi:MAG: ribose 5-phosphate isomerase B [Bryobacterales bacterium]|nr:ribose 5-phosphate isomerase B [Bryobacterales bacterium]
MKISIGADHAGFALKQEIGEKLKALGHDVLDRGTVSTESTDYPDYALRVGNDVSQGVADRGILVCSTGTGMAIAANKVPGVRAAHAWQVEQVQLTREHNDANVLAIGARYTGLDEASRFVEIFLSTEFQGGRHQRRVHKIAAAEENLPAASATKETQS